VAGTAIAQAIGGIIVNLAHPLSLDINVACAGWAAFLLVLVFFGARRQHRSLEARRS
jgi:hypothetical protein